MSMYDKSQRPFEVLTAGGGGVIVKREDNCMQKRSRGFIHLIPLLVIGALFATTFVIVRNAQEAQQTQSQAAGKTCGSSSATAFACRGNKVGEQCDGFNGVCNETGNKNDSDVTCACNATGVCNPGSCDRGAGGVYYLCKSNGYYDGGHGNDATCGQSSSGGGGGGTSEGCFRDDDCDDGERCRPVNANDPQGDQRCVRTSGGGGGSSQQNAPSAGGSSSGETHYSTYNQCTSACYPGTCKLEGQYNSSNAYYVCIPRGPSTTVECKTGEFCDYDTQCSPGLTQGTPGTCLKWGIFEGVCCKQKTVACTGEGETCRSQCSRGYGGYGFNEENIGRCSSGQTCCRRVP